MNKKISTLIAALCLVGALVVPTEELSARTKSQLAEPLFTHAVQTLEAVRQHFNWTDILLTFRRWQVTIYRIIYLQRRASFGNISRKLSANISF